MSLQRAFVIFGVALGLIAAAAGATLIILTTLLNRAVSGIETSVESVRIAEELEVELLTYHGTRDPLARLSTEQRLRRRGAEAARYVSTHEEAELVAKLKKQIDEYIKAVDLAESSETSAAAIEQKTREEFEAAYRSARELIHANVEQSRAHKNAASRWNDMANLIGLAVVVLIVVGMVVLASWLRAAAFRPALNLAHTIERYAKGERAVRSSEEGAAEIRSIAHHFNSMANTLDRQRESQLAFLAGVAHDLRNPLSALKLASAVISPERPLPPEERLRASYARVQRQIDRLDRMVFDLLDAARIEAGRLELQMEECDVGEVVRATVDLFEPAAPEHRFIVDAPEEPVRLTCDPVRIEQVLNNLVSNAIKYSPRGAAVRVTVVRKEDSVELSVADEGMGISADDVGRLFEPFQRTNMSKETVAGVGLGLFVAWRIVEAHGGRIAVESVPGEGSTFRVHLPIKPHAEKGLGQLPAADPSTLVH